MKHYTGKLLVSAMLLAALTGCGTIPQDNPPAAVSTQIPGGEYEQTIPAADDTGDTAGEQAAPVQADNASDAMQTAQPEQPVQTAAPVWFDTGVYAAQAGGVTEEYYIFTDAANGRTCTASGGIGVGFTCEQETDQVIFHMATVDDQTIMSMSADENGNPVGTLGGFTFTFVRVPDADPSTFDPAALQAADAGSFAGTYVESIAGRGVIEVESAGDNAYNVRIHWSDTAFSYTEWTFTGESDDGRTLTYSDCVKNCVTFTDEENSTTETVYTDGSGSLQLSEDGTGLVWDDRMENVAADSLFVRE